MPLITNAFLSTIGYYMGGPTFTAGSGDGADGPPAAPGARIALVVRAVAGPADGHWSFWKPGADGEYGDAITFSYATGSTVAGAALHPGVERIDAVELSPLVLRYAEEFF